MPRTGTQRARWRVLAVGLLAASAYADTITQDFFIPPRETDWSDVLPVVRFDPGLGFLNHIQIDLLGDFVGSMRLENTDPDHRAVFSMQLVWDLELLRPDHSLLVSASDLRLEEGLLDPFDGTVDFDGPSGATFNVDAQAANSLLLTDPDSFAPFIGQGTLELPLEASGSFSVEICSDSYESAFQAFAGATVTITYDYTVPEPSALALLGIGVLAGLRRR